jgi:2'-5' RNA ligase
MTDAADRPPSPPLNPILVERAAEASRIEARLDASIAAIARAAEPTTRRLFVAVMLPGPVAAALATVAEGLARRAQAVGVPISWTAPSDYHLTLRYLGPTRIAAEPAVIDAVADAVEGLAPVPLQLAGLGAFDSPDRARVVWAGVTGPGLAELAQRIDAALQAIGVAELARPFAAHITLGRLPTGSLGLDIALGVGGVPRGRIVEIYGPESSGKTTLCAAHRGRGAEARRRVRLHRRRARARRRLRPQAGRRPTTC